MTGWSEVLWRRECRRRADAEKIQVCVGQTESCVWSRNSKSAHRRTDQGERTSRATREAVGNNGKHPEARVTGRQIIFGLESPIRWGLGGGDEQSIETNSCEGLHVFRRDLFRRKLHANKGVGGRAGSSVRGIRSRIVNRFPLGMNYLNRICPGEEFASSFIRH
jgi:hypothetical protein